MNKIILAILIGTNILLLLVFALNAYNGRQRLDNIQRTNHIKTPLVEEILRAHIGTNTFAMCLAIIDVAYILILQLLNIHL